MLLILLSQSPTKTAQIYDFLFLSATAKKRKKALSTKKGMTDIFIKKSPLGVPLTIPATRAKQETTQ